MQPRKDAGRGRFLKSIHYPLSGRPVLDTLVFKSSSSEGLKNDFGAHFLQNVPVSPGRNRCQCSAESHKNPRSILMSSRC